MGNQENHLTSSKGYTSNPSRWLADDFWWRDNGIRLRVWQYIQHRRSYRYGRGCTDGIRSIARALGYSTGYIGKIVAELEGKLEEGAPVHLDSEIYGRGRRRSIVWPIGVEKPKSIRAKEGDRPLQERTVSTGEGLSDTGTDAPSDTGVDLPSDTGVDTSRSTYQKESEEERGSRLGVAAAAAQEPEPEAQRGGEPEPLRDAERLAELKAELKRDLERLAEEKSVEKSETPMLDRIVAERMRGVKKSEYLTNLYETAGVN